MQNQNRTSLLIILYEEIIYILFYFSKSDSISKVFEKRVVNKLDYKFVMHTTKT